MSYYGLLESAGAGVSGELDRRTTDILLRLGIPASSKGYKYMRCAIILVYNDPLLAEYPTKTLYPMISRLCRAPSAESVGRACRRAVDTALEADALFLHELVSYNLFANRPSCAQVMLDIAKFLHASVDE